MKFNRCRIEWLLDTLECSWVLKLSLLHSNTFSLWQLHFCRASCLLIDKREFVCLVGRLTLIKIVQVSFKNVVIYSFQCIVRWKWRHKEGRRQSSLFSSFFGPGYWWHVSVQLRPELSKRNPATRVDCTMLKYHPHCFKESVNTWLVTKHRCPTLITNALKTSRCTFQHCLTFHHEHVHFKKVCLSTQIERSWKSTISWS